MVSGVSRGMFIALVGMAVAASEDHLRLGYALAVMLLIAVIVGTDYFSAVRGRQVAARLAMHLRARLLDRIAATNLRFIEREEPTRLHYLVMISVREVSESYFTLISFANALIMLLFNFIYIGWLSWIGLVSALAISLVGVRVHWYYEQKNQPRRRRLDHLNERNVSSHLAFFQGYKELRLSRAKEADYRALIQSINEDYLDNTVEEVRVSTRGDVATKLFQYLAITAAALLLPVLADIEPMTIMQLLAAILFSIAPLETVVGSFASFGRARVAMDNLERLDAAAVATRETLPQLDHPGLPPFESLELRGIQFAFSESGQGDGEGFRLGPLDFSLVRGEVVFIVGGNGSGKTVLMRLLTGLYRPDAGDILFNGRSLADADRQALREQYATVFNDFHLFAELLGQHGLDRSTLGELITHYDLAGKTDYVEKENRFSSVSLSTGQRKRLALIVARLEQRPLLVLDEFAADQDPEHRERFYREWLPELRALGCTLIVVSHDDRYFHLADRVVKMDYGRISEVMVNSPASAPQSVSA